MLDIKELQVEKTAIEGLLVFKPKQITDERGTIEEFLRLSAVVEHSSEMVAPVQINRTTTVRGAVRGMHAEDMTKYVSVTVGKVFAAWVDLRLDSPTKGKVVELELEPGTAVLVPSGIGNGFQSISDEPSVYFYCFTQEWSPNMAGVSVSPIDPELGINWPIPIDEENTAQLSAKDRAAMTLAQALSR